MDVKAYAESVGRKHQTVLDEVHAAKVAADTDIRVDGFFSQLVVIHAAPQWLWAALVAASSWRRWSGRGGRDAEKKILSAQNLFALARVVVSRRAWGGPWAGFEGFGLLGGWRAGWWGASWGACGG
jgi:hypothetical protein